MKIEYCKEILALADIGNFFEASSYLYMSQSTLSRHVKAVEEEYGIILFDRTTHKMEITPEGEMLLPYARQIADLYEDFREKLIKGEKRESREIMFGYSVYSLDTYAIPKLLMDFGEEHPEITVSKVEAVRQANWNITLYDFTFLCETAEEMETNGYGRIPVDVDEIVAVMSKNHPLASKKSVRMEELKNQNFIMTTPGSWLRNWCMDACGRAGFQPEELFAGLEGHNMVDMVIRGYGITFLTRKTVKHIYGDSLSVVSLTPSRPVYINMVYLKHSLTPEAKCFLDFMKKLMGKRESE